MEMKQFLAMVQDFCGFEVELSTTEKNNGQIRVGVTPKEGKVKPCAYITEELTEDYAREIARLLTKPAPEFQLDEVFTREYVLQNVFFQLIGGEANEKLLADVPSEARLDMSLVYRVKVNDKANFMVKNSHLEALGLTKEELYEAAHKNTKEIKKFGLYKMSDFIPVPDGFPMRILTSEDKLYGAAAIVYKDLLQEAAREMGEDLYIIPSSIHEVIVIPVSYFEDARDLVEMIVQINRTVVAPEEMLSDNAYRYSARENIIMAA